MDDEETILAREIGNYGAIGGGSGGRWGASHVARMLPDNTAEIEMVLPLPFGPAVEHVQARLAGGNGPLPELAEQRSPVRRVFRIVTGAGFLNLNPAVVTIAVTAADAATSTVNIRGVAGGHVCSAANLSGYPPEWGLTDSERNVTLASSLVGYLAHAGIELDRILHPGWPDAAAMAKFGDTTVQQLLLARPGCISRVHRSHQCASR